MRIALNGESERAARRTLGDEGMFHVRQDSWCLRRPCSASGSSSGCWLASGLSSTSIGAPAARLVAGVWLEYAPDDSAVFQVKLHGVAGEHVGGDGMVGRAAQNNRTGEGRYGYGGCRRVEGVAVGDHAIGSAGPLVRGQIDAHVIHRRVGGSHLHPQVAGITLHDAIGVAVLRGRAGVVIVRAAGLRAFLVNQVGDAIAIGVEVLLDKEVVVAVEEGVHLVGKEQALDRHGPAGAMGVESPGAVGIIATPLEVGRVGQSAARLHMSSPRPPSDERRRT